MSTVDDEPAFRLERLLSEDKNHEYWVAHPNKDDWHTYTLEEALALFEKSSYEETRWRLVKVEAEFELRAVRTVQIREVSPACQMARRCRNCSKRVYDCPAPGPTALCSVEQRDIAEYVAAGNQPAWCPLGVSS